MKAARVRDAAASRHAKRAPAPVSVTPSGPHTPVAALLSVIRWLRPILGIDVRSLALSRAAVAIVLLADVIQRLGNLRAFYSDGGVVPRAYSAALDSAWRWSLYGANGQTLFAALLTLVTAVAALALLLGYRTRVATVVCFVLQASLLNRNPLVTLWSDQLLLCLLFFACFIPWGARWSVDAAFAPKQQDQDPLHVSVASAALLIQVALAFAVSGIAVLALGDSAAASAAWTAYRTALGAWLLARGVAPAGAQHWAALLCVVSAVLIFVPFALRFTRMLALLVLLLGTLVALFTFHLGPAPYVCMAAVALLVTNQVWGRPAATAVTASAVPRLRIFFDRDCALCKRTCMLLVEFLVLPEAEIAPAQGFPRADTLLRANHSWVVIDHDDRAYLKWPALTTLMRRSPVFGALGWLLQRIPGLTRAGDAAYDWIGHHRNRVVWVLARCPAPAAPTFKSGLASSGFLGLVLALILIANLQTLTASRAEVIRLVRAPLELLRLDQAWRLLLPPAGNESGWYLLPGELEDGTAVDVLHPQAATVSYDPPAFVVGSLEPTLRWHLYRVRISAPQLSEGRAIYARYLCRQWNRERAAGHRLRNLKIINMVSHAADATPAALEQHILGTYDCLAGDDAP